MVTTNEKVWDSPNQFFKFLTCQVIIIYMMKERIKNVTSRVEYFKVITCQCQGTVQDVFGEIYFVMRHILEIILTKINV